MQADADGVVDRVCDCGDGRGQRTFAAFFRAEWAFGVDALHDDGFDLGRFYRRWAAIFEQARVHQHAIFPNHFFGEGLAHAHPDGADDLAFDGDRIQCASAVMRGPDFVDGYSAGVFVDRDFSDLRGVRICRRRTDARTFMFAAACVGRRRVGTGSSEGAVEVDGGDYGFFERHPIFRAFIFALLL